MSSKYLDLSRRSFWQACVSLLLVTVGLFGLVCIVFGIVALSVEETAAPWLLSIGGVGLVPGGIGAVLVRITHRNNQEAMSILKGFIADSGVIDESNVLRPQLVMEENYRFGAGIVVRDGQEVMAELALVDGDFVLRTSDKLSAA